MSDWMLGFLTGFIPAGATAIFGWIKWWHELREKRRERAVREKFEAEIAEFRRRSVKVAPYLKISHDRFEGMQIASGPHGRSQWLSALYPCILSFYEEEVPADTKPGETVFLVVSNAGASALDVSAKIDDDVAWFVEPQNQEASHLRLLAYNYRPELHGTLQTVSLQFLQEDGDHGVQAYEAKHGIRWLRRIDPA
ncbi:MAG TPA: hypothetical protein VGM64_17965 [Lacunisphaera sp.]|jgi:hypothetical protein